MKVIFYHLQFVVSTYSEISYDINYSCIKVICNMVLMFYSESSSAIFMRILIKCVTVYNMQKKMNNFGLNIWPNYWRAHLYLLSHPSDLIL